MRVWSIGDMLLCSGNYLGKRSNTKNGSKEFRPVSWNGEKWQWKDPQGPLPLYHKIANTKVNIRMILTHHPTWDGVLGYNEFTHHVNKRKPPPYLYSPNNGLGEWTDVDNEFLQKTSRIDF